MRQLSLVLASLAAAAPERRPPFVACGRMSPSRLRPLPRPLTLCGTRAQHRLRVRPRDRVPRPRRVRLAHRPGRGGRVGMLALAWCHRDLRVPARRGCFGCGTRAGSQGEETNIGRDTIWRLCSFPRGLSAAPHCRMRRGPARKLCAHGRRHRHCAPQPASAPVRREHQARSAGPSCLWLRPRLTG